MLSNNTGSKNQADWNVESIAEQILSDLNGAVSLSVVQEVLKEVIPKYEGAPIQNFVPIFIRRDAVNQLKAMEALFATPAMEAVEALVAADLVEEAVADDVAAAILTADTNETVTE